VYTIRTHLFTGIPTLAQCFHAIFQAKEFSYRSVGRRLDGNPANKYPHDTNFDVRFPEQFLSAIPPILLTRLYLSSPFLF